LKLTIVRGGGVAGLTRQTELASETLPPPEAAKLGELIESAELLGSSGSQETPPPAHADETSYEVRVEQQGRTTTRRFTEQTLPEPVRLLIAWVDSRPQRRSSIVPP
jgi:hypothetical protein